MSERAGDGSSTSPAEPTFSWARRVFFPVLVVLGGVVLVVGGAFIVWNVVLPAWVVAGALFLGATWVHIRTRRRKDLPSPSGRSVLLVLTLAATAVSAGFTAMSGRTYTILTPQGPAACRVVAVEEFFLLDGSTNVTIVGSWIGWVHGPPSEPMRYRPYTTGDYTLTWNNDVPTLTRPDQGFGAVDSTPLGSEC